MTHCETSGYKSNDPLNANSTRRSTFAALKMRHQQPLSPFAKWAILVLLAFIWGSSFILMKRGMFTAGGETVFSPNEVAALRLFIAWLALLPLAIKAHRELWGKHKWALMAVGLFGNGLPAFLFTAAQSRIDSALAGMLNTLVPLFTLLLGVLFFRTKVRGLQVIGVVVGLVGACSLMLSASNGKPSGEWMFAALVVLATICYAISVNVVKRYLGEMQPIKIVALALSYVGIPAAVYALFTDAPQVVLEHPAGWGSLGYIVLLAVFGTTLSLIFFNRLVAGTSAVYASTVTYLIPIVAMLWGLADGEVVSWLQVGCIAVVLSGVYLVTRGR